MNLLSKLIGILLIAFLFPVHRSYAQRGGDEKISGTKTLRGYFLLYRRGIDTTDADHIQDKRNYVVFYVKDLNASVLNDFTKLDSLTTDISYLYQSIGAAFWLSDKTRDSVRREFSKTAFSRRLLSSDLFGFYKFVPKNVIDGNDRFVAVFYGELLVTGPFDVISDVLKKNGLGYIYLKSDLTRLEYLYTIILTPLSEEKKNMFPLANR